MILALDVGNTDIVVGCVDEERVVFSTRISTELKRTAIEYAIIFQLSTQMSGIDLKTIEGAIVSSVVPQLTSVICEAVASASGRTPLVLGPGLKTGLSIRIDDPGKLGGNFVAAAVAVMDRYPLPCVTVDLGTATSFGVIDKAGFYIGGVIAPGVAVSQNALASKASQLPHVSLEPPMKVIGRSTEASMRSGVVYGAAAVIDGILDRIEAELGEPPTVVAAGEMAGAIVPCCRRPGIIMDTELLMRGLYIIYNKNKKK